MERKEIEEQLQKALRELLWIPLDDLEAHDAVCQKSISDFTAFAPILAPADYFTKRNSGELDFTKLQNDIGHKLLEVRRLMEELPFGAKIELLRAKPPEGWQDE